MIEIVMSIAGGGWTPLYDLPVINSSGQNDLIQARTIETLFASGASYVKIDCKPLHLDDVCIVNYRRD